VACVRAESQNEDYDSEELGASAAIRRTIIPFEEPRSSRSAKSKASLTKGKQPRSVTFRKTNEEMQKVVITNAMLSRPQENESDNVHKYGVRVINERALGRVGNQSEYDMIILIRT